MLHEIENNPETQSFLAENNLKFSGDCKTVLLLLYSGVRLTARKLVTDYGIADRRLRDVSAARPDIVKKRWIKDGDGKRQVVEYYIDKPLPPSKREAVKWAEGFLKKMQQGNLF